MKNFTRVTPYGGDWEAWYLNGKLLVEGHSVSAYQLLDALADIVPNRVTCKYVSDEIAERGFPKTLTEFLEL